MEIFGPSGEIQVGDWFIEEELLQVAEASRQQSQADWMVANLFETRNQWAYLGNGEGTYSKVTRVELPERLIRLLEKA